MKRRTIKLIIACSVGFATAPTLAQLVLNEFTEVFSDSWHDFQNWSEGNVPTVTEFALILSGKTCIISTQDGVAGAVGVEDTATLRVSEGRTLTIVTPDEMSPLPALKVNGVMWVENDNGMPPPPAKILFEHLGTNGVSVVQGGGTINGDPGTFDYTGSNEPDHVKFDDVTIAGTWTIAVDLENEGTFVATGIGERMTFVADDCPDQVDIEIGGNGVFIADGRGSIEFTNPEFQAAGNTFTGTLRATGLVSRILLGRCLEQPGAFDLGSAHLVATNGGSLSFLNDIETNGATIDITSDGKLYLWGTGPGNNTLVDTTVTVDGGLLHVFGGADLTGGTLTVAGNGLARFQNGLNAENGDISIHEDGQLLCSNSQLILDDNDLSIYNNGRVDTFDQDVQLQGVAAILIQDNAALECDRLHTFSPTDVDVTVAGGTLECVWFTLTAITLNITGGEFHLIGDTEQTNDMLNCSVAVSGGTFYSGGTVEMLGSSSTLTLSAGALDVRGDNPFPEQEDFHYGQGTFSFTGGTFKVKQNKTVLID